jgi:HPt (histidine-containing phosphotransfer) domain-containing protein
MANNDYITNILQQAGIDGLDAIEGMGRFNNNAAMYMRILHSFIINMPKTLDELEAVTRDTLPSYAVTVHGAKGSCYGISANACGDAAKALEMAAKAGDFATVEATGGAFIQMVLHLIDQLKELEEQIERAGTEANGTQELQSRPSPTKLRALREATENYDILEMQRIVDELAASKYEQDAELVPWLKDKIDSFAYDEVVDRLRKI